MYIPHISHSPRSGNQHDQTTKFCMCCEACDRLLSVYNANVCVGDILSLYHLIMAYCFI